MSRKNFRLPLELDARIERELDKAGGQLSFSDYVQDAVEHFLECSKLETEGSMKLIVLKYPAVCLKCQRKIEAGEWGLWGRGVGAICLDDYVERMGDKAIVSKFLKMRELKQVIKALQLEADRLADTVEESRVHGNLENLKNLVAEMHKSLMEYLRAQLGTADENAKLEDLTELCERLLSIVRDHETLLMRQLPEKRWKKRAKQTEAQ